MQTQSTDLEMRSREEPMVNIWAQKSRTKMVGVLLKLSDANNENGFEIGMSLWVCPWNFVGKASQSSFFGSIFVVSRSCHLQRRGKNVVGLIGVCLGQTPGLELTLWWIEIKRKACLDNTQARSEIEMLDWNVVPLWIFFVLKSSRKGWCCHVWIHGCLHKNLIMDAILNAWNLNTWPLLLYFDDAWLLPHLNLKNCNWKLVERCFKWGVKLAFIPTLMKRIKNYKEDKLGK